MSNAFEPVGLTGERRYRVERRWGRDRVILQVQERGKLWSYLGGVADHERVTKWRDARPEDITQFGGDGCST